MEADYARLAVVQMHAHAAFANRSANYLDEPCLLSEDEVGLYGLSGEPKMNVVKGCIRRFYLENLQTKIDAILKYCGAQKVDLVVFPEYSIPAELLPLCAEISKSLKMVIAAGSHTILSTPESQQIYRHLGLDQKLDLSISDPGSDIRTVVAPVFLPDGEVHLVSKQSRSPWERDMIVGDAGWKPFEVIFRDTPVRIALLLCIDALTSQKDLPGGIDLAVVPSWSPSTKPFQSFAQLKLLQECAVMYANVAHFGESQILARFGQRCQHWFMSEDGSRPLPKGEEGVIGLDVQLGKQYEKRHSVREHFTVVPVFHTPLLYLCESELANEISQIRSRLKKKFDSVEVKELEELVKSFIQNHSAILPGMLTEKLQILANDALPSGTSRREDLKYLIDYIGIGANILPPSDLRYAMTDYCISKISGLLHESSLRRVKRALKCLETLFDHREQLAKQICHSPKTLSSMLEEGFEPSSDTRAFVESRRGSSVSIFGKPIEESTLASFQDRGRILNVIRDFVNSDSQRILVIQGMPGIGKTTLIRHAFTKILPRWNQIWIDVTEGMAFPRLIMQLGKNLEVKIPPEMADSEKLGICRKLVASVVADFDAVKSTSLVLDNIDNLFDLEGKFRDKRIEVLVDEILARRTYARNKVFMLSNRKVELETQLIDRYLALDIRGLTRYPIERLLEFWTRFFRETDRDRKIEIPYRFVSLLHGHPLLAKIAANYCRTHSLEEVISDLEIYHQFISSAIGKLLEKISMSEGERRTMEYGSIFRSDMVLDVFRKWGGDESVYNVDALVDRFLIEKFGHVYTIHPMMKEYFRHTLAAKDAQKYHRMAADYYLEAVDEEVATKETIRNIADALFHVAASGDLERLRHLKLYYREELRPAAQKAYRQYKDYRLALGLYKMLLDLGSDDADVHFHLALCYGRLKNWPEADTYFERATQLSPSTHWIYRSYGSIKLNAFKVVEAEKLFAQALELSPDDPDVLVEIARLRAIQRKHGEADGLFRKVLGFRRKHRYALYCYGRYLFTCGRLPQARKILERALSVNPGNDSVMELLNKIRDEQGRDSSKR